MSSKNFWQELNNSILEDGKYDLKKIDHYNFSIHNNQWEKEIISCVFHDIEKFNLFVSDDKDLLNSYEKLFLNILIKEEIDYSIFFTELKKFNLINLKNAYLKSLKLKYEQDGVNWIKEKFVPYLKSQNKLFNDRQDVKLEIIESDLPDELKKTYIEYNYSSEKVYLTHHLTD